MPTESAGYDPETIALLERCLDDACAAALAGSTRPINEDLRRRLAASLMEGASLGIREREVLIGFALRALPSFKGRPRTE